jgi:murein DD-endopeptidase MepM/ murein hydrolase activator NlpD
LTVGDPFKDGERGMDARKWTLVVVPPGTGESRAISVSLTAFKIVATGVAVVGLVALGFVAATAHRAVELSTLDRLERRNTLLAEELARADHLLTGLSDTIAAIAERDRLVRMLAGLEPNDPDVQLAGVGGPATWTADDQVLSESPEGRAALGFRTDLDGYIRRASLLARSYEEAADSLEDHVERLEHTPSISPIPPDQGWFTSGFALIRMHPIYNEPRPHSGIDVSAPMGTPILAPAKGRVSDVRTITGYGRTVTIDHGNGIQTFFAHCSKTVVRVGQVVDRGDKVAEVGKTGIATGPHVHYEVLVNGKPVNPRTFIFPKKIVD